MINQRVKEPKGVFISHKKLKIKNWAQIRLIYVHNGTTKKERVTNKDWMPFQVVKFHNKAGPCIQLQHSY